MGHFANQCGTPDSYRDGKPVNELFQNQNHLAVNKPLNNSTGSPSNPSNTTSNPNGKANFSTDGKTDYKKVFTFLAQEIQNQEFTGVLPTTKLQK